MQAADSYLDSTASGANNGTSWANAWQAVSNVTWAAVAGNTLWVQGGNYGEQLDVPFVNNVTIKIATNAAAKAKFLGGQIYTASNFTLDGWLQGTQFIVFNGTSSIGAHGYQIREATNILIRGLEIDRSLVYTNDTGQNHGIACNDNVDLVTIDGCYIHHTTGLGVNFNCSYPVRNAYDSLVLTNTVINSVGDGGMMAGKQFTMAGCSVNENGIGTYFGAHPDGVQLQPDGFNVRIFNNVFSGFNQNIFIEAALSNVFIYNNITIGTHTNGTDRGIDFSWRTNFAGTLLIANNVTYNFITFSGWNMQIAPTNAATFLFKNNIFVNCKIIGSSSLSNLLDASNLWWDEPGVVYYTSDTESVPDPPGNRYAGAAVNSNPLFVDSTNRNFRVRATSPAINTGSNLNSYFTADAIGTTRGSVWDIGAYEYVLNTWNVTALNAGKLITGQ